jgi:hypothetical protein
MAGERATYRMLVKCGGEHVGPEAIAKQLKIRTIDAELWLKRLQGHGLVTHSSNDNSWSVIGDDPWFLEES